MKEQADRFLVPPLGWPIKFQAFTVTPAEKHPWMKLNRYPRQTIGIAFRLPDEEQLDGTVHHKALSLMWAKPARWWKR